MKNLLTSYLYLIVILCGTIKTMGLTPHEIGLRLLVNQANYVDLPILEGEAENRPRKCIKEMMHYCAKEFTEFDLEIRYTPENNIFEIHKGYNKVKGVTNYLNSCGIKRLQKTLNSNDLQFKNIITNSDFTKKINALMALVSLEGTAHFIVKGLYFSMVHRLKKQSSYGFERQELAYYNFRAPAQLNYKNKSPQQLKLISLASSNKNKRKTLEQADSQKKKPKNN